jgi:hypothetical protein
MPEHFRIRNEKGILPLLTGFQVEAEHTISVTGPEDAFINRITQGFHDSFLRSRLYPTQVCMERK